MMQSELNRAVASVTGETVQTIADMGFVPLTPLSVEREPQKDTLFSCPYSQSQRRIFDGGTY